MPKKDRAVGSFRVYLKKKKGEKMLESIGQGDILKCLNCGEPIKVDEKTLLFDSEAEYIFCPKCRSYYDVSAYHFHGEKIDSHE